MKRSVRPFKLLSLTILFDQSFQNACMAIQQPFMFQAKLQSITIALISSGKRSHDEFIYKKIYPVKVKLH